MIHGRGVVNVRGDEVLVRIDGCYHCRGRRQKERLIFAACVIFMLLAAAELLLLLAGGL